MKNGRGLQTAIAVVLFAAASAAAAPSADRAVTVGQFARQVVAVLGQDAHDFESARASLRTMGVTVHLDASAPLTARIAARVARDLGVRVIPPPTPEGLLSAGQAAVLAGHIAAVARNLVEGDEDMPTECLSSENRGVCVSCCKEATGEGGQLCGRFCLANPPQGPSPEEPLP